MVCSARRDASSSSQRTWLIFSSTSRARAAGGLMRFHFFALVIRSIWRVFLNTTMFGFFCLLIDFSAVTLSRRSVVSRGSSMPRGTIVIVSGMFSTSVVAYGELFEIMWKPSVGKDSPKARSISRAT